MRVAQGKRAGARPKRQLRPVLLALALAVTAALVAWGYLVVAAIDFGTTARNGDGTAWWFLALAATGAMLCLFLGFVLAARVARELGLSRSPGSTAPPPTQDQASTPEAPPTPGGRRAAR